WLELVALPRTRSREKTDCASLLNDLRYTGRWRRVPASLDADRPVNDDHSNARQIAALNTFEHGLSRRMLCLVNQNESCGAPHGNQSGVQLANFRGVPRGEAEGNLGRHFSQRRQHRDHAEYAEWLHP